MSQFLLYDRNRKIILGIYPSSQDAQDAGRNFQVKSEGKHGGTLVWEVLTASDPDYVAGKSKNDR